MANLHQPIIVPLQSKASLHTEKAQSIDHHAWQWQINDFRLILTISPGFQHGFKGSGNDN